MLTKQIGEKPMKKRTTIYIDEEVLEELDKRAKALNMSRSTLISRLAFGKLHNPDINNHLSEKVLDERLGSFLKEVKSLLKDSEHNPDINLVQITEILKILNVFRLEASKNHKIIKELLEDSISPSESKESYVP
jgi:hypothetical protein